MSPLSWVAQVPRTARGDSPRGRLSNTEHGIGALGKCRDRLCRTVAATCEQTLNDALKSWLPKFFTWACGLRDPAESTSPDGVVSTGSRRPAPEPTDCAGGAELLLRLASLESSVEQRTAHGPPRAIGSRAWKRDVAPLPGIHARSGRGAVVEITSPYPNEHAHCEAAFGGSARS